MSKAALIFTSAIKTAVEVASNALFQLGNVADLLLATAFADVTAIVPTQKVTSWISLESFVRLGDVNFDDGYVTAAPFELRLYA